MKNEDNKDIEIPNDDDENIGEGIPKKREKKRKSKEERKAERKVVFWTMLAVLGLTLGFWLMPKINEFFNGNWPKIENKNNTEVKTSVQPKERKNYVEITL